MPRVEYTPVPTVRPEQTRGGIATPPIHVEVPSVKISDDIGRAFQELGSTGFGALSKATQAVAGSYDNLGKTLDGVGNELFNRAQGLQQLDNETKEKKALVEYDKYTTDQSIAFKKNMGDAASPEVLKAHIDDLDKKRNELRDKLPKSVQNSFDTSSISVMTSAGRRASEHAATQMKGAASGASQARIDMEAKGIGEAGSIDEAMKHFQNIEKEARGTYGPLQGFRKEETDVYVHKKAESGFAAMITRISRTDPTTATKILGENHDLFITPGLEERVRHEVQENDLRIKTGAIADRAAENPDAPLEEKLEKGRKMADEVKDQPELRREVEQRIKSDHHTHNEEVNEVRRQAWDKVQEGMDGIKVPGGKMPKDEMGLFAQGEEYREAWGHLTDRQKIDARHTMARLAMGDIPASPETDARVNALWGLHDDNPEAFRDLNIRNEKIPRSEQNKFRTEQRAMAKQGHDLERDPKTRHGLDTLKYAGVLPKDMTPSHSKYNEFVGVFRQGLKAMEADLKYSRPLKEEEIVRIGRMALEKSGGFMGIWQHQLYQDISGEKIPPDRRQAIIDKFPNITEPEMQDMYMRLRMRQEYQKRYGPKKAMP